LQSFFKGPVPTRPKKTKSTVVRSTSHQRYTAPVKASVKAIKTAKTVKAKKAVKKVVSGERRSAKSYIKKPSVEKSKKPQAEKKAKVPAKVKKPPQEFYVGEITHYFAKISVVVVKVEEHPILIADTIIIKGTKEFSQKVQSLQVESKDVRFARKGELVGLQVIEPAKPGDKVFKIKK